MSRRRSSREIHGDVALVKKRLLDWLGGGTLQPVEGLHVPGKKCSCGIPEHHDALEVARLLDAAAHIDYIHQSAQGVLRGIGVRVREFKNDPRYPWNSFTLRTVGTGPNDLELEHVKRALLAGDEWVLRPAYHVQIHLTEDRRVESVGMIRMADLVAHITAAPLGAPECSKQTNGWCWWVEAKWDDLEAAGVPFRKSFPLLRSVAS